MHRFTKRGLTQFAVAISFLFFSTVSIAGNAKPAFNGTTLAGWHKEGSSTWRIEKGEVVGTASQDKGGWLVLDEPYEEVGLDFWFRCGAGCDTGVLLGMQKAGNQTTGIYLSLAAGEPAIYQITLDGGGNEVSRQEPAPPAQTAGGRGGAANQLLGRAQRFPGPPGHPLSTPLKAIVSTNDWNHVELHSVSGDLSIFVNGLDVRTVPGVTRGEGGTEEQPASRFGRVAFHIAGKAGSEVRFRDVTIQDYTEQVSPKPQLSRRFEMQQLNPFQFGDGMAVGDLNKDGHLDLVSGPMYYAGPDFRIGHEIEEARPFSPIDYKVRQTLGIVVADFTGDGWDDVLMTHWPAGLPGFLYVNPRGERRRWTRHNVIPAIEGEFFALADIDEDGKPEFVYGAEGNLRYAEPDPSDATKPWVVHIISEKGPWGQRNAHGLGVGDVNGDGHPDVLTAWGWWEHPGSQSGKTWTYHPAAFGRAGNTVGGSQMYVYDVNGDKLPDVISALEGHSLGLAWFEQKRTANGDISFTQHTIMDRDPAKSHGVVFGELHSLNLADVDGDGLKDIVTGSNKYNWTNNSYIYPASDADGVVYWFKLVRKPGGAVYFVPQLVYNNSGMGRQIQATDLNGDGVVDLATNGKVGTYIFFGKKGVKE